MKTLAVFDDENCDPSWKKIERRAARAVIVRNGVVALDACEAELKFALKWVDVQAAYDTNTWFCDRYETKFVLREARVLGLLLGISKLPGKR